MNESEFYKRYPELYQFVSLFNPVAHGAPLDDEKVVAGIYFDTRYRPDELARIKAEAEEICRRDDFPAEAIAYMRCRDFADAEDCKRWLLRMVALTERRVRAENA